MNKKELEGVVFDADGTLFDTERLGYWAWEEAGRQMGCPQAADYYPEVVGRGRGDVLALLPRLLGPDFPHEPFMELRSRLATERMEREGCPISRRTVAKYREELGIPSTAGRKRYEQMP